MEVNDEAAAEAEGAAQDINLLQSPNTSAGAFPRGCVLMCQPFPRSSSGAPR